MFCYLQDGVVFNDLFTPHILVINEFKIEMVSRIMQNKLWKLIRAIQREQIGVISIKELSEQNLIREQDGKKVKNN